MQSQSLQAQALIKTPATTISSQLKIQTPSLQISRTLTEDIAIDIIMPHIESREITCPLDMAMKETPITPQTKTKLHHITEGSNNLTSELIWSAAL